MISHHVFFKIVFSLFCRKKGKKGGKAGKKNESIAKIAIQNSKVWETRLEIAEKSKQEYRSV